MSLPVVKAKIAKDRRFNTWVVYLFKRGECFARPFDRKSFADCMTFLQGLNWETKRGSQAQ